MADLPEPKDLTRPERIELPPTPPLPEAVADADKTSVIYSTHRTKLSTFRTRLSEHRTDLSEFRTDLSMHRTNLSGHRTQMSMRRTGMSFQRTRMSAERTLMSVMRTSLSLIGFGFTIYQGFKKLHEAGAIAGSGAPRNFGLTLVLLGVLMLVVGMVHHLQFMRELRHTRTQMTGDALIHGESRFPVSFTFITAALLLLLGLAAAANIVFRFDPFG